MDALRTYLKWILALQSLMLISCVEEFEPQNISFEDLLVVEATLTDEFKRHEVRLSRTFQFGDNPEAGIERGAQVTIVDDIQNSYVFREDGPGVYVSVNEFSAEQDRVYTLRVTTQNNKTYNSAAVKTPEHTAQVTGVSFKHSVNGGREGIDILVDSFDPMGNSRYYRYEFEETQRIVAPYWGSREIVVISDVPPFQVDIIPRTEERRTCYKTSTSDSDIVQTETNGLSEDRVTKFPVKFIHKRDSVIRDRYSILVKQHVQTLEAYTYYQTLNDFSSSESVFSENQPGFINGNIVSESNPDEKVLGFFEVNSVSSGRLFINYREAFPGEDQLPYFSPCSTSKPLLIDPENLSISPLIEQVKNGEVAYLQVNEDFFGNPVENPPYEVVTRACGDCTVFGTNVRPDFWTD